MILYGPTAVFGSRKGLVPSSAPNFDYEAGHHQTLSVATLGMSGRANLKSFDLTTPCRHCHYRIPPHVLLRVGFDEVRCSQCRGVFEPIAGKKPSSTS